jgi:DNA ligase-1
MLLSRIAEASTALATTRSRNAKRDLIADLLRDATADDVEIVVAYLGGSLRQRRTGVGWRTLADLPPPAEQASLSVTEADAAFAAMAQLSGGGSTAVRSTAVADLFGRATAAEQDLLRGLVSGELRQGALDAQVQEGLAVAFGVSPATVRRAAMLLSSTTAAARLLLDGGAAALDAVGLRVGTPVQPMLAASAPDPDAAATKVGLPALADHKLDGIRVQVHRQGGEVRVFTRSLDDITSRLPEVVAAVAALPYERLVLDGEVLAFYSDGRPESFQVTASRTASGGNDVAAQTPVQVFFFDLLHVDGHDLLDVPLRDRVAEMTRVVPAALTVPRRVVATPAELDLTFTDAVRAGFEGVVVKDLEARYSAGRRESSWVKVKPRHTLDLVVTAAEWGYGRRRGWLSNLHLAARDPAKGGLVMLGKTFKGMTDAMLTWQTEHFLSLETHRTPSTVYLEPSTVVEIAVDGLQRSSRYPGGVALRFARVLRYRPDKSAADADSLDTVRALDQTGADESSSSTTGRDRLGG